MATMYARVKRQRIPLSHEQRKELGKIIADAYAKSGINYAIHRVPVSEQEGAFMVLSYHRSFSPIMDKIIRDYWMAYKSEQKTNAKRLSDIQGVSTKPRKRKPIQPLYSFKPKN